MAETETETPENDRALLTPAPVRDEKGRWLKGSPSPNPIGRPTREAERRYLETTIAHVSVEDWGHIVTRAVTDAKAGDKDARSWLSKIFGLERPDRDAVIAGAAVEVRITRADDWRVGSGEGEGG